MSQSIKYTSMTTVKRIEGTRRGVAELPVVDPEKYLTRRRKRSEGRKGGEGTRSFDQLVYGTIVCE